VDGTRRAKRGPAPPSLAAAIDAFLETLDNPGTARGYAGTLRALAAHMGPDATMADLALPATAAELCSWFSRRWGKAAAATWNRNLDAFRSSASYWAAQGWLDGDPTQSLCRRRRPPDRTRALSRAEVEGLVTRSEVNLRDKTLWRMLYETAARISEVLSLDVTDLNLATHQARVRRKGGAADVIVWQTGTARLLPRLLEGRKAGPVFLTERRARLALPGADLDPTSGRARLSYRRAAEVFEEASGGSTLHQLRHSALTHAAEDGANTSTLLAFSGHTSVTSLSRYARVSSEALARWQEARDPARRRR
jgi:site-specific recombinase XerD